MENLKNNTSSRSTSSTGRMCLKFHQKSGGIKQTSHKSIRPRTTKAKGMPLLWKDKDHRKNADRILIYLEEKYIDYIGEAFDQKNYLWYVHTNMDRYLKKQPKEAIKKIYLDTICDKLGVLARKSTHYVIT